MMLRPSFLPYVLPLCVSIIFSFFVCMLRPGISRLQTVDRLPLFWAGWQWGPLALQSAFQH
jgi:hypothetical protein